MAETIDTFNIPVPGSGRFEQDVMLALTKLRGMLEDRQDVDVAKVGSGTRTLHFQGGRFTDYTDS